MLERSSCNEAMAECMEQKYFAIAHLYKEEKTMKMHLHDCYELYYSISGGKQFLIGNTIYEIQPGDVFVINQYETHSLTQIDTQVHERIVISIDPEYIKKISTEQTSLATCFTLRDKKYGHRLSLSKEQRQRFLYLINKILLHNEYGHDIIEQAAFMELMVLVNKVFYTQQYALIAEPSQNQYNVQVQEILEYINKKLTQALTLDDLAQHFYLSKSYICRIFKNSTGVTINKYITARRINIAKALLAEGTSVTEACIKSGYNDYSNFIKAFTKEVGISPKKYALLSLS